MFGPKLNFIINIRVCHYRGETTFSTMFLQVCNHGPTILFPFASQHLWGLSTRSGNLTTSYAHTNHCAPMRSLLAWNWNSKAWGYRHLSIDFCAHLDDNTPQRCSTRLATIAATACGTVHSGSIRAPRLGLRLVTATCGASRPCLSVTLACSMSDGLLRADGQSSVWKVKTTERLCNTKQQMNATK